VQQLFQGTVQDNRAERNDLQLKVTGFNELYTTIVLNAAIYNEMFVTIVLNATMIPIRYAMDVVTSLL
jgi:hypothetical protein